jgi:hypothetical protein
MIITKFVQVGNGIYLCVPKLIRDQLKTNRHDVWLISAPNRSTVTYKRLTPRLLKSLQQSEERLTQSRTR